MRLIRPVQKYISSYAEAVMEDELYRQGEALHFSDPETVVERARKYALGVGLPEGYVPATMFWLVEGDRFLGRIDIRHKLNPALEKFGGHIGFAVRWSETRKGYGTKMLAMALPYCRDNLYLRKVLITCDDDNIGSQ